MKKHDLKNPKCLYCKINNFCQETTFLSINIFRNLSLELEHVFLSQSVVTPGHHWHHQTLGTPGAGGDQSSRPHSAHDITPGTEQDVFTTSETLKHLLMKKVSSQLCCSHKISLKERSYLSKLEKLSAIHLIIFQKVKYTQH